MQRIVTEDYKAKQESIAKLSDRYNYEPWRIRLFDMQRASVQLTNPPHSMLSDELRANFLYATLILQGNGFTFTTSEISSVRNGRGNLATPYLAKVIDGSDNWGISLAYDKIPVEDFLELRLVEIMGKPVIHYFPFKDKVTGQPQHTYLVVNPYENCAFRCKPCSRLPFFKCATEDYEHNIQKTVTEVSTIVNSPEDVKFINIITGSTDSAKGDIALYKKIIEAFNDAGFGHCEYGVYTPNIEDKKDMRQLNSMGVVFFTATMEVTSPEARMNFYGSGNAKGRLSFQEIIGVIKQAEEVFPYVNTNLMLGYEPLDELKSNWMC